MRHLSAADTSERSAVDCGADPIASLVEMFVAMVQGGRIAKGQCPALRPVFLKPHGVAHGTFRIRPDLPDDLQVGLFSGNEYPAWVRFSSDTLPTLNDFKSTVGIGIKLFDAPGPKIFGNPSDTTFDLILQNFDVFFVDTAADMCAFTKAGVVDGNYDPYLAAHPRDGPVARRNGKARRQHTGHGVLELHSVRVRRRANREIQARTGTHGRPHDKSAGRSNLSCRRSPYAAKGR